MLDEDEPHQGPHDHRHISTDRKVADPLSLPPARKHERRHRCRSRRPQCKDDPVNEAQRKRDLQPIRKEKARHQEKEQHRDNEEQALLIHRIDHTPCERAGYHSADLKAGHRHPCLPLAEPQIIHDVDRQRRDHDVLRHEIKEIRETHTDELTGP